MQIGVHQPPDNLHNLPVTSARPSLASRAMLNEISHRGKGRQFAGRKGFWMALKEGLQVNFRWRRLIPQVVILIPTPAHVSHQIKQRRSILIREWHHGHNFVCPQHRLHVGSGRKTPVRLDSPQIPPSGNRWQFYTENFRCHLLLLYLSAFLPFLFFVDELARAHFGCTFINFLFTFVYSRAPSSVNTYTHMYTYTWCLCEFV